MRKKIGSNNTMSDESSEEDGVPISLRFLGETIDIGSVIPGLYKYDELKEAAYKMALSKDPNVVRDIVYIVYQNHKVRRYLLGDWDLNRVFGEDKPSYVFEVEVPEALVALHKMNLLPPIDHDTIIRNALKKFRKHSKDICHRSKEIVKEDCDDEESSDSEEECDGQEGSATEKECDVEVGCHRQGDVVGEKSSHGAEGCDVEKGCEDKYKGVEEETLDVDERNESDGFRNLCTLIDTFNSDKCNEIPNDVTQQGDTEVLMEDAAVGEDEVKDDACSGSKDYNNVVGLVSGGESVLRGTAGQQSSIDGEDMCGDDVVLLEHDENATAVGEDNNQQDEGGSAPQDVGEEEEEVEEEEEEEVEQEQEEEAEVEEEEEVGEDEDDEDEDQDYEAGKQSDSSSINEEDEVEEGDFVITHFVIPEDPRSVPEFKAGIQPL